tara:strand:- start:2532 stop:2756 length:225 start_codon:yes stop_codon:yes gene_type:complete
MELNLHRVTECKVVREFHGEDDPIIPGLPRSHAFHVTHLTIIHTDGTTAKLRLFGPERLEIINEGDDDGSTSDI